MPLPRIPLPANPGLRTLMLLVALYLLPGLIGHDPWKSADATHFGIILNAIETGHWFAPQLFGQPHLEYGPLYYWVTVPLTQLFGLALPLHDGARLAGGLFGLLYLTLIGLAARAWFGTPAGLSAVLLGLGSIGLLVHVHMIEPAIAILAAQAGLLWTLGRLRGDPKWAAATGLALAAVYLTGGMAHLLAGAILLVATAFSSGRWIALAIALALGLTLSAAWPLGLKLYEPPIYAVWQKLTLAMLQHPGRIVSHLPGYLTMMPWFAWPALPIAVWTLWKFRRQLSSTEFVVPITACICSLLAMALVASPRSVAALPALPPLVLLASPGLTTLRRGAANLFDWFGTMTFSVFVALAWLGWIAMMFGWPAQIAHNFAKLEPGFVMRLQPVAVTLAALLTLAWIWLVLTARRSPTRGALIWGAGIATLWGLVIALWLPWVDYGRSYRQISASLARALPEDASCIAERGLSEVHRVSLHYFAHIETVRDTGSNAGRCRLLLVYSTTSDDEISPGRQWTKLWEDGRPGTREERFRLYQRTK